MRRTAALHGLSTGLLALTMLLLSGSHPAVAADVTGTITPGGPPVNVTLASGDNALLTFTGTAGGRVSLNITGVSITFSYLSIRKPDGTNLVSPTAVFTSGKFIDTQTLPASGTYTVYLDPYSTYSGSATLTLYQVPADAVGAVSVDTSPSSIATTVPGQDGLISFEGSAGQEVFVVRTDVTMPLSTVKVLAPSGSLVSSSGLVSSADGDHLAVLPVSGTYSIRVDGYEAAVGQMAIEVSTEADVPGVLDSDQAAVSGSDEVPTTPVAPQPVSPVGAVPPGSYTTELWDAEATEAPGGLT